MSVGGKAFSNLPYRIEEMKENQINNITFQKKPKKYLAGDFKIGNPNYMKRNDYVYNFCQGV